MFLNIKFHFFDRDSSLDKLAKFNNIYVVFGQKFV